MTNAFSKQVQNALQAPDQTSTTSCPQCCSHPRLPDHPTAQGPRTAPPHSSTGATTGLSRAMEPQRRRDDPKAQLEQQAGRRQRETFNFQPVRYRLRESTAPALGFTLPPL